MMIACLTLSISGLAGCTSSSGSATTETSDPPAGLTADMHGLRYCEVLLISASTGVPVASVYNTYPLNECPPDQWAALDPKALAAENGALIASLNGPRYWMIDRVQKVPEGQSMDKVSFGGMEMYEQATVALGSIAEQAIPYIAHPIERSTIFTYTAGTEIFRLTTPDGAVYVMQSFSQQKDPSQELSDLPSLSSRLELPQGWTFDSEVLAEDLQIITVDQPAQVLQDDLGNSYSLIPSTSPD